MNDGNGGITQTSVGVSVHGQDDIEPAVGISVVDMTGRYQRGFTDCYASSRFGDINNAIQLGDVTTLLNDGYTAASSSSTDFSLVNSVNNYLGPVNTMTLDLEGNGTLVDTFDFVSSRRYSLGTVVEIEALDCGGQWVSIYLGTTGAIGVVSGAAQAYQLDVIDTNTDTLRLTIKGAQLSLHEISVNEDLGYLV